MAIMQKEDEAAGLLVPEFKSIHHEPVDGPTECVMLFRGEFRSFCLESQWSLPSWGDWFVGCDMAPAYAYHRRVLESVGPFEIRASGYSFLEEMAWRVHHAGFRIGEVPIVFEQRTRGVSKIDSREIYRAAWHVLTTALRRAPAPVEPKP